MIRHLATLLRHPAWTLRTALARLAPSDPAASRLAAWRHGTLPRRELAAVFPGIGSERVEIHRPWCDIPGTSLEPFELLCLVTLVRHRKPMRLLEIGTFDGNTARNLAANAPEGARVTTVDLPEAWRAEEDALALGIPAGSFNVTDRARVGRRFLGTPQEATIRQVFGDSAAIDWDTLGGPFDFVLLDGCHHFEYVRSDTARALAHLAPDGLLVWHDYGMLEGVSRAVDGSVAGMQAAALEGTRLAVAWRDGRPPR